MKSEFSAGGVVFKKAGNEVKILLCLQKKLSGNTVFCLPKGHLENGETWEDAALREVFEETGVSAKLLCPLTPITFFFYESQQRVKKVVHFFLMEFISQDFQPNTETEEIIWSTREEALSINPYKSEKETIMRAFEEIDKLQPA
jgi:ADP-ribose pyrophosphatase YjhB (NUDIX family)